MCHMSCIEFGKRALIQKDIEGKRVIEVGSLNVNGSLRNTIMKFNPLDYIGIDIIKGLGVDIICRAEDMIEEFGENSFDVVVSTELIEHVKDWRKVISNIKNVCKLGGIILITTRSYGFPFHGYPHDFWRYELEDMEVIFSDCEILILEKDNSKIISKRNRPGVFLKIRKPKNFKEKSLSGISLYKVNSDRKLK